MEFTTANSGAPYAEGDQVLFTWSGSGLLFLDTNPEAEDGSEITLEQAGVTGSEYIWRDTDSGLDYAVSLTSANELNEINVLSGSEFLGQFTLAQGGGSIQNLNLITERAGTYDVVNTTAGTHDRGTVSIGSDGAIDFDTNISFAAGDIQVIYDRIECCARIQASYGADDDAEVINIFLTENGSGVASIQFRHRNEDIDIQVEVSSN
jgi:hypothetical protein